MTTIMPQSELTSRALQWITDARAEKPGRSMHSLLDEAGMRFNLSPVEARQRLRLLEPDRCAEGDERRSLDA